MHWFELFLGFFAASVGAYTLYYLTKLVSTVKLVFVNSEKNNRIVQLCPLLRGRYWPSPWVFNCHLQVSQNFIVNYKVEIGFYISF